RLGPRGRGTEEDERQAERPAGGEGRPGGVGAGSQGWTISGRNLRLQCMSRAGPRPTRAIVRPAMRDVDHGAATDLLREEERVAARSAAFKKELGTADLVLTQILFIIGLSWVGVAARLGPAHVVFWLLAIVLFYVPTALVVIHLNRLMPLEGGLYQWAKLGLGELTGFMVAWNSWVYVIVLTSEIGLIVSTNLSYALGPRAAWMAGSVPVSAAASLVVTVAMVLLSLVGLGVGKWVHNAGGALMIAIFIALVTLPVV